MFFFSCAESTTEMAMDYPSAMDTGAYTHSESGQSGQDISLVEHSNGGT